MNRKLPIAGIAAIVIGVGVAGCALAGDEGQGLDDDVAAMLQAQVTLTEAIMTAEKETGGKAIKAGPDDQDGARFIVVAVAQGKTVSRVLIDPQTGRVAKIAPAEDDDENDE